MANNEIKRLQQDRKKFSSEQSSSSSVGIDGSDRVSMSSTGHFDSDFYSSGNIIIIVLLLLLLQMYATFLYGFTTH